MVLEVYERKLKKKEREKRIFMTSWGVDDLVDGNEDFFLGFVEE